MIRWQFFLSFFLGVRYLSMILVPCLMSMQMTNEIGKAIFSKAGELKVPVGFMCMKVFCNFPNLQTQMSLYIIDRLYLNNISTCGWLHGYILYICWNISFIFYLLKWHVSNRMHWWVEFFQGLDLHISEIEQLCTEFPSTVVLLDHLAFCKPPTWATL